MQTYSSQMLVDSCDSLVGAGLQQLGCDDLLDCQDDTIFRTDADGGAAVLYCLDCVLNLEVTAIRGEDGVGQIVASSYRRLQGYFG